MVAALVVMVCLYDVSAEVGVGVGVGVNFMFSLKHRLNNDEVISVYNKFGAEDCSSLRHSNT